MNINFHLVVSKSGSVKTVKSKPSLGSDEIAIAMNMTIPDALFRKPQLCASIVVPDEAAVEKTISAVTVDNFKEAITQAVGLPVQITITQETK